MNFAKFAALSFLVWSVTSVTAQAQPPIQPQLGFNPGPYLQWCDQVEATLRPALRIASVLYGQNQFERAKQTMVDAFRGASANMNLPGTFRPNTYRELVRSLNLIAALEASATPPSNLKSKMLAYVSMNRANFVIRVKNVLDRPYIIPCAGGACGGYGQYPYQPAYGNPAANIMQFESTLARMASEQLGAAQQYATVIRHRYPSVIPMVDAQTYYIIIGSAARWAAEDLGHLLFGQMFACSIGQLHDLGAEAELLASSIGDPAAVQFVHLKVDFLKSLLEVRPYCNHGDQRYGDGHDHRGLDYDRY